jgi:hypothetical protein
MARREGERSAEIAEGRKHEKVSAYVAFTCVVRGYPHSVWNVTDSVLLFFSDIKDNGRRRLLVLLSLLKVVGLHLFEVGDGNG